LSAGNISPDPIVFLLSCSGEPKFPLVLTCFGHSDTASLVLDNVNLAEEHRRLELDESYTIPQIHTRNNTYLPAFQLAYAQMKKLTQHQIVVVCVSFIEVENDLRTGIRER
jgi:hypothetical protein